MPIYEYQCPACAQKFERIVPYAQRDEQSCECGMKAEPHLSPIAGHRYYGGVGEGFHRTNIKADL